MRIFERLAGGDYEQVVVCQDRSSGLRALIAIHSTVLGPALGGTRFFPYPSDEAALDDVLRLSRAMTYKAAAAGLDLGGGKAVIVGDPHRDKSEALLRAYARFVHSLGGRYVTAEDVGTTQDDMDLIRRETPYVTGVSETLGGSGDPSRATAYGVLHAMKAVARHLWRSPGLERRPVVVSGVGKVGSALVEYLVEEGAEVTVADVAADAVARVVDAHGVGTVPPEKAHAVDCDLFSPCALGGVLSADTIPELRCAAVVGAANNQLADGVGAEAVAEAGVLYVPDFVANAGGIINITEELHGYDRERAYAQVSRVEDTTLRVLRSADAESITTDEAARRLAEDRIAAVGRTKLIRTGRGEP